MKCCKYSAGMLREVVTFQRKTRTSDGAGGFTTAWAAISGAPTRAMVKAMSGGERWASMRTEATATHRVVVRYFADMVEGDRVLIRGKPADITFINNVDYDDKWLEISANLGAAT